MAQRFAVEEISNVQSLTGAGADYGSMGMKAFEPTKPEEVSLAKPSPALSGPGGLA
jgi:hypothetical protein